MAIHAQKTTFRSSAQFPDFLVTGPLTNGQTLSYSELSKAFVNVSAVAPPSGGGGGTILGATNIGSGADIFNAINISDELELRTLLGGQGISLSQGVNEIEISNDIIIDGKISVPHSFTITIDNDDTTASDAIFSINTYGNPVSITASPTAIFNAPALDLSVVLPSSFVTATGDFIAAGFVQGMGINVLGTSEQDGIWEIDTVTNDTITITIPFPSILDAGIQPATTIDGMFASFSASTLSIAGRNFNQDGFFPGYTFTVAGSTSNDGTYTVSIVAGDSLLINETFPAPGIDVANITLEVPVQEYPTGWQVNELGEMISNSATINGNLTVTGDNDLNIGTGTMFLNGVDIIDIINNSAFAVPTDGLIVQTASGVFDSRSIDVGTGLVISDADGVAGNPTITVDPFDIILAGELTGTATVTDLGDTTITASLAPNGVPAGSYNKVIVDSTGRVTSGDNITIIGVNGITVANGNGVFGTPTISAPDFDIVLGGDVSGSATITALTNTTINVALDIITTPGTYNTVTVDNKGRVVSGALVPGGSYQSSDPALDILSGGLTNPGYVVWDGTQYIDRTLNGVANETVVTNTDGALGNTTIGLADNPVIPGTGAMTIPRGFAVDYPAIPTEGMIRYHMNTGNHFEGYMNGAWEPFLMGSTSGFLPLSGGTMVGHIDMNEFDIVSPRFVDGRDLNADGLVLDDLNVGTGFKVQIAPGDFANRAIDAILPIVITNGDGQAGNPTVEWDMTLVPTLEVGQIVDQYNDSVLIYDNSQSGLRRVSPKQLFHKPANKYFMSQF